QELASLDLLDAPGVGTDEVLAGEERPTVGGRVAEDLGALVHRAGPVAVPVERVPALEIALPRHRLPRAAQRRRVVVDAYVDGAGGALVGAVDEERARPGSGLLAGEDLGPRPALGLQGTPVVDVLLG